MKKLFTCKNYLIIIWILLLHENDFQAKGTLAHLPTAMIILIQLHCCLDIYWYLQINQEVIYLKNRSIQHTRRWTLKQLVKQVVRGTIYCFQLFFRKSVMLYWCQSYWCQWLKRFFAWEEWPFLQFKMTSMMSFENIISTQYYHQACLQMQWWVLKSNSASDLPSKVAKLNTPCSSHVLLSKHNFLEITTPTLY